MVQQLTSEQVWKELERELFAVLGMVTHKGEARTIGIVYIVYDHKLYIATEKEAWKTRHIKSNSHVSITVPIAKRIPFMPWIKIPAATISFSGKATVFEATQVDKEILKTLFRALPPDTGELAKMSILEIEPQGEFVTYGVGITLMQMRFPEKARGRAPIAQNYM